MSIKGNGDNHSTWTRINNLNLNNMPSDWKTRFQPGDISDDFKTILTLMNNYVRCSGSVITGSLSANIENIIVGKNGNSGRVFICSGAGEVPY